MYGLEYSLPYNKYRRNKSMSAKRVESADGPTLEMSDIQAAAQVAGRDALQP